MMIPSFRSDSSDLPCVVSLSDAYAASEITAKEYNGAQRVAELEDSIKKPIYEATWADVQVGDTVLVAWPTDKIQKVEIADLVQFDLDNEHLVSVGFRFDGRLYDRLRGQSFRLSDPAYVQSRL